LVVLAAYFSLSLDAKPLPVKSSTQYRKNDLENQGFSEGNSNVCDQYRRNESQRVEEVENELLKSRNN
jgi:hypothetical protein